MEKEKWDAWEKTKQKNEKLKTSSKQEYRIDQKEQDPPDSNIDESTLDKIVLAIDKGKSYEMEEIIVAHVLSLISKWSWIWSVITQ